MNWTAGIANACLFYLTVLHGLTHSVPGVGGGGHSSGTTTHSGLLSVCSPSHTALSGPLAAIITHTILSLHMLQYSNHYSAACILIFFWIIYLHSI